MQRLPKYLGYTALLLLALAVGAYSLARAGLKDLDEAARGERRAAGETKRAAG